MAEALQVDAIAGERLCYFVHSEADPRKVYRVDMLAHGGRSECSCTDWQTRRWPIIRDGGKAMCKHIKAARYQFLEDLLQRMAKQEEQP